MGAAEQLALNLNVGIVLFLIAYMAIKGCASKDSPFTTTILQKIFI